ncbi:MAG: hypothetical protein FWG12_02970 [Holophagaceae bacterium]|jgi:hypothetical protein|nr:hypothetical protein [Holophagaceae bacterium]
MERHMLCETPSFQKQRGDGKIGFIVTLLLAAVLVAAGIKAIPAYLSNNKFISAVEEIAGRASNVTEGDIRAQILAKAKELKIAEAQEPGAIAVARTNPASESTQGMCTVRVRYTRNINMYGVTSIKLGVDKEIAKPFMVL